MAKITTGKKMEDAVQGLLADPFEPAEVKWKPQTVRNDKALAVAYIDARAVMDRLDEVMGTSNWRDRYQDLGDGAVSCRLSLRFGSEWVTKEDVGGQSEQPDEHDRHKAAFSDALKRAAVKFGIGRYLYRLPMAWVPFDVAKRRLVQVPPLPEWALPRRLRSAKMPRTGGELKARLVGKDAELATAGLCPAGALLAAVLAAGRAKGLPDRLEEWGEDGVRLAVEAARGFERGLALKGGAA